MRWLTTISFVQIAEIGPGSDLRHEVNEIMNDLMIYYNNY